MPTKVAAIVPQTKPILIGKPVLFTTKADTYAPIAINPACPIEKRPVKPVRIDTPKMAIK